MLPDIRALVAAVVTAVGLLMISFGLVATFRVAQEHRSGSLQADLAQRGRLPVPVYTEPRTILIVEAPAPEPRAPAPESAAPEMASLTPVAEANEAPATAAEAIETPVEAVMLAAPPPEPPSPAAKPAIGGPLEIAAIHSEPRDTAAETAASQKAAKKAAAKKARAARLARERKVRRAAQARRAQDNPAQPFGSFGGTFNQ